MGNLWHILWVFFLGPAECIYSRSGQQTGREGLHDGGGDLQVPHAQLHHNAPVAHPGMLCSHGRRVSLTLLVCVVKHVCMSHTVT